MELDDEKRLTAQAQRIRARWENGVQSAANITDGSITINTLNGGLGAGNTYSGSGVTPTSDDFLGDWRSADSWQRFDAWRVVNRSRQLERGNALCIGFKRNMLNNVLGAHGIHSKVIAKNQDEGMDDPANAIIKDAMEVQGMPENFTTRKVLSRRNADRLLLSRWIFDGEFILRKRRGFANDCGFAWQIINPDYLDRNLNRLEPNGNMTIMGVERDKDYKFPVAYWFLLRRPNDFLYRYSEFSQNRYERVDASEVIHVFTQTDDDEQTRGWPWIFAAMINLNRSGKFQESALINAMIGASRGVYFKKTYPDGFMENGGKNADGWEDTGSIRQDIPEGSALELPVGVEPVAVDMRYPDQELGPFLNAMNLGIGMCFGTSYQTTTGDLSEANFVSSRQGTDAEQEVYMGIQVDFIERWKVPSFDEELYRGMITGRINLPISKFEKFNAPKFTGRRWKFVQPVDDLKAKEIAMNNRLTAPSMVIEEMGGDPDEVFAAISRDEEKMKALGFARILTVPPTTEPDPAKGEETPGDGKKKTTKPAPKPPKDSLPPRF